MPGIDPLGDPVSLRLVAYLSRRLALLAGRSWWSIFSFQLSKFQLLINRKDRKDRKAGNLRESGFSPER